MSLIRVGHHGRTTGRRKRTIKKPAWDSTINDLSVYKATREELIARTMRHQSKNHMAVKLEKMRKEQARKDKTMSPADVRKMAIMKEILYDQSQLEEALSKSDRMMAVVKDLFGDDPKRYTGFPNITSVSTGSGDQNKSRVVAPVPEIYTKMDALSDSVTNTTALNEYHSSESDEEDDEVRTGEPIVYQPKMNLRRFQQFVASEEERNRTVSSISGPNQASRIEAGPAHSTRLHNTQDGSGFETPKREHNESIEMLRTPRSAINDTKRVKKTKKRTSPQKSANSGGSTMQFTDFRKVLITLQEEIAEFERQTGRCPPAEQQRADTLSGYTVALVDAVTKLARYLRQTDLQLKGEIAVQETLSQDMFQFRTIVDSLTTDLIYTQEEYAKLVGEFEQHRCATANEIAALRQELQELKGLSPREPAVRGVQKASPEHRCLPQDDRGCGDRASHNSSMLSERDYLQPQPSAILLSPLIRKTRLPETAELAAAVPKRQTSLIDIPSLADTVSQQQYTVKSAPQYQIPVAVASVTVPRPQPLVQCNVGVAWSEVTGGTASVPNTSQTHVRITEPVDVMQTSLSSVSTYHSLPVTATNKNIAAQIAELNKQHEEAQKRIELLQKGHYSKQQQMLHQQQEQVRQQQLLMQQKQQELVRHQQQQLQQNQQPQPNGQPQQQLHQKQQKPNGQQQQTHHQPQMNGQPQQKQQQQIHHQPQPNGQPQQLQQGQYDQQTLQHQVQQQHQQQIFQHQQQQQTFQQQQQQHEIFEKQQKQMQHQQQSLQQQQQQQGSRHVQISQPQQTFPQMPIQSQGSQSMYHHQHQQELAGPRSSPQHQEQAGRPQGQQYYVGQQQEQQNQVARGTAPTTVTAPSHSVSNDRHPNTQLSYYKNLAAANGVSPPISPISTRSDGVGQLQQTRFNKVPGRGITVSVPTAELDMSGGSLPSPRLISSQQ